MKMLIILAVLASGLSVAPVERADPSFTDKESILAVSRYDQAPALKTKLLEEELTLAPVIEVLTTYRKVSREQYLVYAHQTGACGTVTLKGGATYLWEIEPGYAATVTGHRGVTTYLLHPRLKIEPAHE